MANQRRGDVDAWLNGERYTLRLTLGALAELESAFGASDLVALAQRFEGGRLASRDLLRIIGAGLRGGGAEITDDQVARMSVDGGLSAYVNIVAALIAATFGDPEPGGASQDVPRAPQGA